MDLRSFLSLLKSIHQVEAAQASRNAWTSLIASATDSRLMKDHIRRFSKNEEDDHKAADALADQFSEKK